MNFICCGVENFDNYALNNVPTFFYLGCVIQLKHVHKCLDTAHIKFKRQNCYSTFVVFVDLALTSVSTMFVRLVLLFQRT